MKRFYLFLVFLLISVSAFATSFIRTEPTATSTSTQILAADQSRTYLLIQNKGSDSLYVKMDSIHSASEGIEIAPGGNWEPPKVPANSIWVKSASNPDTLSVIIGR